jgi:ATP-dependent DNA ligase
MSCCSVTTPDVWLEPAIVVEVLADEITPSPRHTAGMTADRPGFALRFPRIVSLRDEKKAEDATSVRSPAQQSIGAGAAALGGHAAGRSAVTRFGR